MNKVEIILWSAFVVMMITMSVLLSGGGGTKARVVGFALFIAASALALGLNAYELIMYW